MHGTQNALKQPGLVMHGIILTKCQYPVKQLKIRRLGKVFELLELFFRFSWDTRTYQHLLTHCVKTL